MSNYKKRELPKTRIATLFITMNVLAIVLVAGACWTGFVIPPAEKEFIQHLALGLIASVLGLGGLVAAMFYLITTGSAVKQAVGDYKLDAENYRKTVLLKKRLFPLCMAVVILLIATTVLGGAVHVGNIDKSIHLYLALLSIILYIITVINIAKNFRTNRVIMADVISEIEQQEESKES